MNFSDFGSLLGPGDAGGSRGAQKPGYTKYDDLAGASVLRRSGKAAVAPALHGSTASRLLASRRRNDFEDRLSLKLREFYQNLLGAPVPDRLVEVVKSLDAAERSER